MATLLDSKDIIRLLVEEKGLLFQEKLQLIRTMKQTITFLGIVPTLLFGTAYRFDVNEVYLAIPLLLSGITYYVLTHANMFALVSEYIDRLDRAISILHGRPLPFYQMTVGSLTASWGLNITKGHKYVVPNPYFLFGGHIGALGLGIVVVSTVQGSKFLADSIGGAGGRLAALAFLEISLGAVALLAFTGAQFLRHHRVLRKQLLDESIGEIVASMLNQDNSEQTTARQGVEPDAE